MDAATRNEMRSDRGYSKQDPDEIKRDIDRTRAHLDESVVALSNRLSPRRLVDEFVGNFTGRRDSSEGLGGIAGEGGQMLRSIRDHPVPAALIGAGIAWLLVDRARGESGGQTARRPRQVGRHDERSWLAPGATYEPSGEGEEEGEGRMREMAESGRKRAADAGHKMRDAAHRAGESISHAGHAARDKLSSARERFGSDAENLRERASRTTHAVRDAIEEHPVAVGAAALAIGLFAGLAVPATRSERRVMGEARDELFDEARRTVKEDVAPRVRETAMAAAHAGVEGATGGSKEHAGEQISQSASEGIHRAGEAIREEMRNAREGDKPE